MTKLLNLVLKGGWHMQSPLTLPLPQKSWKVHKCLLSMISDGLHMVDHTTRHCAKGRASLLFLTPDAITD